MGGGVDPDSRVPPSQAEASADPPTMLGRVVGPGVIRPVLPHSSSRVHSLRPGRTSLGRARDNDIVVNDLLASRRHAELHVGPGGVEVVDLGTKNGTFVNGRRISHTSRTPVGEGAVIAVGHHVFQLEGSVLAEYVDSGDVAFEADGLNVFAGAKQLLHDITFRLPGRALLGVVGPSGAGKSVLLDALTGFRPADAGFVRYAGRDMYAEYHELRHRIGYVHQEDVLHTSLTVRAALEYSARLRFPPETTGGEQRARVEEVLAELGLAQYADTQISKLTGRLRKRTSVALELLTRPTLLYLDEPTSGVDPTVGRNVMESLRALADDGRTLIVVTSSVAHLDLCDYVLVLAPGGYAAYFGPPNEAPPFFGRPDWPAVFEVLTTTPGPDLAARFRGSRHYIPASVTAPSARPTSEELPSVHRQPVLSQLVTLSRRSTAVVASDRSYLWLVIAVPFLLGLIPRAVPGDFTLPADSSPNTDAATILLVTVLCACLMGMANSIREIVKERAIYRRERSIGLSRRAYLGSKVFFLAVVTTLQAIPFTLIGLVGREPPDAVLLGSSLLECLLAVIVVSFSSAMLGLVVSATVDNADKTMPLLVLVMMAQLAFSGGILPVEGKPGLEQVSVLAPARWGYVALSSVGDLNTVTSAGVVRADGQLIDSKVLEDPLFDHTAGVYLIDVSAGIGVGMIFILVAGLLLRRMDPKTRRHTKHTEVSKASR